MVTTRKGGSGLSDVSKRSFDNIISLIGRTDISLIKHTKTLNSNGRILSITDATAVTISGDLQFVTVKDKQWIDLGFAKIGDGIFYTYHDTSIDSEDDIVVDGVNWEISKQIEGETINGNMSYQAWIVKRTEEG